MLINFFSQESWEGIKYCKKLVLGNLTHGPEAVLSKLQADVAILK